MNPLFIGLGATAPSWYRCALPAHALGADWVGTYDNLGGPVIAGNIEEIDYNDYDIIVAQQPYGEKSLEFIKQRQSEGKKVIFECDDFLHGVKKIEGHKNQKAYHKKRLRQTVEVMQQCDAMICSTEFLSNEYSKYNPNQFVCENGIETEKYNIERPEREPIIIGWAGGTGHHLAVGPWLEVISTILSEYEYVMFASIGVNYAQALEMRHEGQTLSIPWSTIENYPYSLTNIDIAIAPSHDSKYFKSKSDLRWLEASAAGIPCVVNPINYHDVEDHQTGLIAETPKEALNAIEKLIDDPSLKEKISNQAREYVKSKRDISITKEQWENSLEQIASL